MRNSFKNWFGGEVREKNGRKVEAAFLLYTILLGKKKRKGGKEVKEFLISIISSTKCNGQKRKGRGEREGKKKKRRLPLLKCFGYDGTRGGGQKKKREKKK